jgi:hypothetical protein
LKIPLIFGSLPIVTRRAKTTGLVRTAHRAGCPEGSVDRPNKKAADAKMCAAAFDGSQRNRNASAMVGHQCRKMPSFLKTGIKQLAKLHQLSMH